MRIVWTRDEKRALQACMVDMCYVTPSYTNKGLLQRAQEEVLPYERRQKITDQKVFSHKVMINNARFLANEHHAKARTLPAAKPPELPAPAPEPVRKLNTLGEVFELFIDALADRIMDKMIAAKQQVERQQEVVTPDDLDKAFDSLYPLWKKSPTVLSKPLLPTVTIIGLNGQQIDAIKSSYPKAMYCFMTAEEAKTRPAQFNDHVILMTKFINHSVQTKYRKHPNLHYCNGGVSDLKHQLQIIFHKETV